MRGDEVVNGLHVWGDTGRVVMPGHRFDLWEEMLYGRRYVAL